MILYRTSHQRYFVRKGVFRNFTKFTGKHLCQSLFFNKVAGLRPPTLLKKRLWHRCFPMNFVKFLRTPFLQNTSGRLLLPILIPGKKTVFCEKNFFVQNRLASAHSMETCKRIFFTEHLPLLKWLLLVISTC